MFNRKERGEGAERAKGLYSATFAPFLRPLRLDPPFVYLPFFITLNTCIADSIASISTRKAPGTKKLSQNSFLSFRPTPAQFLPEQTRAAGD